MYICSLYLGIDYLIALSFFMINNMSWADCPSSSLQTTGTSVQFSSVAQSCPTLCDPMNYSTPGLPVHHQLPEFT